MKEFRLKQLCGVCEDPITTRRGKDIIRCAVCTRPVCFSHVFKCKLCLEFVCENDIVGFTEESRAKTSYWMNFTCKTCIRSEQQRT